MIFRCVTDYTGLGWDLQDQDGWSYKLPLYTDLGACLAEARRREAAHPEADTTAIDPDHSTTEEDPH